MKNTRLEKLKTIVLKRIANTREQYSYSLKREHLSVAIEKNGALGAYATLLLEINSFIAEENAEDEEDVVWYEHDKIGDLIPMAEFVEDCISGGFCDDDGCGYYASKDKMTRREVSPGDVISGEHDKKFTHVRWYNK